MHLEIAECHFWVTVTLTLTSALVKINFVRIWLHIKLKLNAMYDNIQATFHPYAHPRLLSRTNRSNKVKFSENGHVAYQIKDSGTYNNVQPICLSLHAHLTPEVGSKGQNIFFLKPVMLHIKLKAMIRMITCKQIFCTYTHPPGWGLKVKTLFRLKVC